MLRHTKETPGTHRSYERRNKRVRERNETKAVGEKEEIHVKILPEAGGPTCQLGLLACLPDCWLPSVGGRNESTRISPRRSSCFSLDFFVVITAQGFPRSPPRRRTNRSRPLAETRQRRAVFFFIHAFSFDWTGRREATEKNARCPEGTLGRIRLHPLPSNEHCPRKTAATFVVVESEMMFPVMNELYKVEARVGRSALRPNTEMVLCSPAVE